MRCRGGCPPLRSPALGPHAPALRPRALEQLKARCEERRAAWIFLAFSASGHLTTVDRKFRQAKLEAELPEKLVL